MSYDNINNENEEILIPVNGYVLVSIESELVKESESKGILLASPEVGGSDPTPILTVLAIDNSIENRSINVGDRIMAFTHFGVNKFIYRDKECALIPYEEIVAYYVNQLTEYTNEKPTTEYEKLTKEDRDFLVDELHNRG